MRGSRWWRLVPRPIRSFPAELAAVVADVILTVLSVVIPVVRASPRRAVFGLADVLFVPGEAFVAALFPEAGGPPQSIEAGDRPIRRHFPVRTVAELG